MYISNADARITQFCSDFFERLEGVGCCGFRIDNPEKTVSLLLPRVAPTALKRQMRKRVSQDETLETNVRNFIKALPCKAVNFQAYAVETKKTTKYSTKPSTSDTKKQKQVNIKPKNDNAFSTKGSSSREQLLCMWEEHRKKSIWHSFAIANISRKMRRTDCSNR